MSIAEITGAATLIGILLTASLVVYLIRVANRITSEMGDSRTLTSTSAQTIAENHSRELKQISETLSTAVRDSVHEMKNEIAKLSVSIELTQSTLSSALKSQGCELRDLASALHETTISRLSQHELSVISALRELRNVRQVDADVQPAAAVAEAKLEELPPATAAPGVTLAAPLGEAAAVVDSAAESTVAETGSLVEAHEVEAADHSVALPPIGIYSWEDLPERVRARWVPRISQMILPPVSYYSLQEDASPKELVAKAKNDPVLCAKILAVANSAAQGQANRVTSIERAAVQLGTNLLQIIISAYHLEAIFGHYSGYSKEHFKFVQKWSCESSVLAYHIALEAGSADYAMLSTAALISRLGSLLLGMADIGPDEQYRYILSETDRSTFEMERWKVCTPLLSERIAQHWELPEPLPILLRLQEKPMFQDLTSSPEDRNLLIICASSVLASAFISQGGENLPQVLNHPHYAVLKRNTEFYGLQQAVSDAWANKALQREFMTIVEMTV